jgi:ribosomal-protein-alanine N-acetyltransferase
MFKLPQHYQWSSNTTVCTNTVLTQPSTRIWQEPLSLPVAGFELRPLHINDATTWASYLNLPEVFQHTSWNRPSVTELEHLIRSYNQAHSESPLRLGIYQQSSQDLCGTVGFHSISQVNHSAELAYDLHPNFWGRGLISHSARALINWSFTQRHYQRIQATILPENRASIKVIERLGFEYEGRLRHYRMVRGEPRDYLMYSCLPI